MRKAAEIMKAINGGWNLGNSFDCFTAHLPGGETGWGNPVTTRAMIDAVAEKGFNIIRIPVTWFERVDDENNYTIDPAYLMRVKEVVDWAIADGMFVIINAHHENSWTFNRSVDFETRLEKYGRIWEQIAEYFRDYPDLLLFEAMNEPREEWGENEWGGATPEIRGMINQYQKRFVEIVRSSGGNNRDRCILITTAGAAITEEAIGGLEIPEDHNLMVSLHFYLPFEFVNYNEGDRSVDYWDGSMNYVLEESCARINRMLVQKEIPVLITEFGADNKNGNEAEVMKWADHFMSEAAGYGMKCIWWDNNCVDVPGDRYALLKRETLEWVRPALADVLTKKR